jgi:hypothetical protein
MTVQFLLFVIAVLLVSIFWELSKINNCLKTLLTQKKRIMTGRSKTPHDIRKPPNLKNRKSSREAAKPH